MNEHTQGRAFAKMPGMALLMEDYLPPTGDGPPEVVSRAFENGFFESGYATANGGVLCIPPDAMSALLGLLWRYERKHGHRPTVGELVKFCDTLREVK